MSRYHRLNLSRRRGNAVRETLTSAGVVERVTVATRSGQVVLYQLTDLGRNVCASANIDPGARSRESLEHSFWANKVAKHFENEGYEVLREHPVKGNGAVDILAQKPGQNVSIEVETGKSNTKENLNKIKNAGFDRIVLFATSPVAVIACEKAINSPGKGFSTPVKMLTWLDIS